MKLRKYSAWEVDFLCTLAREFFLFYWPGYSAAIIACCGSLSRSLTGLRSGFCSLLSNSVAVYPDTELAEVEESHSYAFCSLFIIYRILPLVLLGACPAEMWETHHG